jgi:CSLREA domain-containing protein
MNMSIRKLLLMVIISILAFVPASLPVVIAKPEVNTYVVNSNADTSDTNPGDGICDIGAWLSYCTLRAAIEEANADGVETTIKFSQNFTGTDPIAGCGLPAFTEALTTIDASNQWDTLNNRPGVEIIGSSCTSIDLQTVGTTVMGLLFVSANGTGLKINNGSYNTIGGTGAGQRNVFISGIGISVDFHSAYNWIIGNYFGTIDGVYAQPSITGISLWTGATNTTIEKNLIVGHSSTGIEIMLSSAHDNVIKDNIIGLNVSRSSTLPNGTGIYLLGTGQNAIDGNTISGNTGHGIEIVSSNNNNVTGSNLIGGPLESLGNGGDGIHITASFTTTITGTNQIQSNGGYGVYIDGDSNAVLDNIIRNNGQDGVYVENGDGNQIGLAGDLGNEIIDNGANGVHLGAGAVFTSVAGNYIGLQSGALPGGNQLHGIYLESGAAKNMVGGEKPGEGNWIGYNNWSGIYITGAATTQNYIVGNVIGAPITWEWQSPNGHHGIAIYGGAHNNTIGWSGAGNTVLSSSWSGIAIVDSDNNQISGNSIGTDGADVDWGNGYHGIDTNGTDNIIAYNEIAYHGVSGVRVDTGAANTISENSIHDNKATGIELVGTGNHGLAAPVILQATCQGPVSGTSCPGCKIEIFSDGADEGKIYEKTVFADINNGAFVWNGQPNGPNVTATATDGTGNTSPFSVPVSVGICNNMPSAGFTVTPTAGSPGTAFHFDASSSSDQEDPSSALMVRWDWENDGTYDTKWTTSKTSTYNLATYGINTIRLQVRDSGGLTDTIIHQVTVSEQSLKQLLLPLVSR